MFFENEVTRTLTLFEFLLVALIGLSPAAISIWIEPVFARSRVAEDEKGSPAHADRQPPDAAGRAGCFLATLPRHSSEFANHGSFASFPRHSIGTNRLGSLW